MITIELLIDVCLVFISEVYTLIDVPQQNI
jgi:hypothetical protein